MTPPLTMRIFGKIFRVHLVPIDHPQVKEGDDTFAGRCDTNKQEFFVAEGQPFESEQDTMLHEPLHAINDMLELEMNERQITCIATALLAVFKDNPEFIAYLGCQQDS